MRRGIVLLAAAALSAFAGCGTMDFSSPMEGRFDRAGVVLKNFTVIGDISISSTETHRAGPLGFTKSVEGAKITYSDLMLEAARMDADDIIDVRIDKNTGGRTNFAAWLTGWERTFTHTGRALAIKYTDIEEEEVLTDFFRR